MSTSSAGVPIPTRSVPRPGYVALVFALVFVWGFGDAASTLLAFAFTGDPGLEANPLIRSLLARTPLLLVAAKAAVALVVGLSLLRYRDAIESVPLWRPWMVGALAFGVAIVVSNLYVGVAAVV